MSADRRASGNSRQHWRRQRRKCASTSRSWAKIWRSSPPHSRPEAVESRRIEYLQKNGVDLPAGRRANIPSTRYLNSSVGGVETLTSQQPLPEEVIPTPLEKTEPVTNLLFEKGTGKMEMGNRSAILPKPYKPSRNWRNFTYAIGRDIHVGDTIIGIKGRVGFEAAAPLSLSSKPTICWKNAYYQMAAVLEEQSGQLVRHAATRGAVPRPGNAKYRNLPGRYAAERQRNGFAQLHPLPFRAVWHRIRV